MPTIFEDLGSKLQAEANVLAQAEETDACGAHLRAFNFGRAAARMEHARDAFRLRVRWFFWGAAAGVAIAAVYFHLYPGQQILRVIK